MCLSVKRVHGSLGNGEKHNYPLSKVFRNIRHEHSSCNPRAVLKVAIKTMNDFEIRTN